MCVCVCVCVLPSTPIRIIYRLTLNASVSEQAPFCDQFTSAPNICSWKINICKLCGCSMCQRQISVRTSSPADGATPTEPDVLGMRAAPMHTHTHTHTHTHIYIYKHTHQSFLLMVSLERLDHAVSPLHPPFTSHLSSCCWPNIHTAAPAEPCNVGHRFGITAPCHHVGPWADDWWVTDEQVWAGSDLQVRIHLLCA